jgi:hypothetical protein
VSDTLTAHRAAAPKAAPTSLRAVSCPECHSIVPIDLLWAARDLCPRCFRSLEHAPASASAA